MLSALHMNQLHPLGASLNQILRGGRYGVAAVAIPFARLVLGNKRAYKTCCRYIESVVAAAGSVNPPLHPTMSSFLEVCAVFWTLYLYSP